MLVSHRPRGTEPLLDTLPEVGPAHSAPSALAGLCQLMWGYIAQGYTAPQDVPTGGSPPTRNRSFRQPRYRRSDFFDRVKSVHHLQGLAALANIG